MVPSFDPELNLIYIGTSVTSPAPKFLLAGNDKHYLYHNSTLALNARLSGITNTSSTIEISIIPSSACWSIPPSLPTPPG